LVNMSVLIDITGNKYGHLTVLERYIDENSKDTKWKCICDCGNPNPVIVFGYNLKNGNTTSCGCVHLKNGQKTGSIYGPIQGKKNKKYNKYDLTGEYGIGYTLDGKEFYFDIEDYDIIKDYCWHINKNGYVVNKTNKKPILMHRLVMGVDNISSELEVDHIHHKTNDNRKSELRIVTSSQNKMNKDKQVNNTSGVRGIWFNKNLNRWVADIGVDHKTIHLGTYYTIDEAAKARKDAEIKYFGEYRYQEGGDEAYD